jgi:hypothetical protein
MEKSKMKPDIENYSNYIKHSKTHSCPKVSIVDNEPEITLITSQNAHRVIINDQYVVISMRKDHSAFIRFNETKTIVQVFGNAGTDKWQIFSVGERELSKEEEILASMVWATLRSQYLSTNKSKKELDEAPTTGSPDSTIG